MNKYLNLPYKQFFKYTLIISLFFHILAIIFSDGFHRPDEHLGIMRWMSFKLGLMDDKILSWEYPARIRPWLQPYLYTILLKPFYFLGFNNPFHMSLILRVVSSTIGFYSLYKISTLIPKYYENEIIKKIVCFSIYLTWFLPFLHARTSSENFSLSFFLFGIYFLESDKKLNSKIYGSIFLSLSFIFRFQTCLLIAPYIIGKYFIQKVQIKKFLIFISVLFLTTLISTYIDKIGYNVWTFTPWNYVYQNIFKGVASGFGVSPFYYYLDKVFSRGVPPLSLIFMIPCIYLWIKKPLNIWSFSSLVYFISHSLIGHKEVRFILPMFGVFPFVLGYFLQETNFWKKLKGWPTKLFLTQTFILLFISTTKSAYGPMSFYKNLYYSSENIEKIYTLNVIRDKLKFYLKKDIPFEHIQDNQVNEILKNNSEVFFLMDKFHHREIFFNNKKCKQIYLSYPEWVMKIKIGNWQKRSKVWSMFKCN